MTGSWDREMTHSWSCIGTNVWTAPSNGDQRTRRLSLLKSKWLDGNRIMGGYYWYSNPSRWETHISSSGMGLADFGWPSLSVSFDSEYRNLKINRFASVVAKSVLSLDNASVARIFVPGSYYTVKVHYWSPRSHLDSLQMCCRVQIVTLARLDWLPT